MKTYTLVNKIFLLLVIIMSSCSPQKRLHRLLALNPELTTIDTIRIQDTTIIPEIKIDTIVHHTALIDTITITKEKLQVKILQVNDTVYIEAHHDPDTIIVIKEIPVEKIIHIKPEKFKEKVWGYLKRNILIIVLCIIGVVWLLSRQK